MEKRVRVPLQLTASDKFISIPVKYTVVKENLNVTVYKCELDLPIDEIPDWFYPHGFSIRKVYCDRGSQVGITVTSVHPNNFKTLDAHFFVGETIAHIDVREMNECRLQS